MNRYISDCHFFHRALNERMDCRGFKDAEEMNEIMIEKWNEAVNRKDQVFILGDFSLGKTEETEKILNRLNGKIYMIRGNHDRWLNQYNGTRIRSVRDYAEISDDRRNVILSHYPIPCYNKQFQTFEDGTPRTYMLYGHVHNTADELLMQEYIKSTREKTRAMMNHQTHQMEMRRTPVQMINCFCMYSDYKPLTLDEWIVNTKERTERMSLCK